MHEKALKIGIFDSGVGGLTVLRALLQALPNAHYVYFGDTAHLPYGNKPRPLMARYCKESVQFLAEKEIDLLVIACHTVSTNVFEEIQKQFSFPIVGMREATLQSIKQACQKDKIALLATENTIRSGNYQKEISEKFPASRLFPLACPHFVPLIEQGKLGDPLSKMLVFESLKQLQGKNIQALVLACTHFPIMANLIQEAVGAEVAILDPAQALAEQVKLLTKKIKTNTHLKQPPSHQFYLSKATPIFSSVAASLLQMPVSPISLLHSSIVEEFRSNSL